MAKKKYFLVGNQSKIYYEHECEFEYFNGFALTQKHKSIDSFHHTINENNNFNILEISSKSQSAIGRSLSAFNLKYKLNEMMYPVECVYQSSKVFEYGGPYKDLLFMSPLLTKKDSRLRESGRLLKFDLNNKDYSSEPKTLFYDWLYCNAVYQNKELSLEIIKYDCFTDIEFNHMKSINCQARSAAIYVGLCKKGLIDQALSDINIFKLLVYPKGQNLYQITADF
ncbi:MAG: hypothetical protein A2Y45_08245 [Tenericutes bacterium GWC2_34_14]|nr:MAG: hypothetical protein A2Z84_03230 [Tenericutes bacterium GWA2_35_7]OHE29886.1 MAG: hypothetical protein A2Y45_08245 [Tenericutes bacterium GWC2_34_14]OHE34865.1 MAG: hypothetical protein A2012_01855 [Tenericutes bacterium GWE2_34_108]OHE37274.1 MAG: hypothetical protein A2Y46_01155 [Tenericutes bacterium GWF1_35_14]OHE39593.1 MAG: hypothetical protein A2Y44_01705 [Tenericutes bacterium GWF2_35_184]OHE41295.1 MAG: hypothetical protein A3K26_06340 [Tenericutes bacterium RIFOXYA12_FULL_35_